MKRQGDDRLRAVEQALRKGDTREALAALAALERVAGRDPALLQRVAEGYTHCTRHGDAWRCLQRAARLAPSDPHALYNLATAGIAVGRLDEAERHLDRVIDLEPLDADAWYNRATLRRQTPDRNHVAALETMVHRVGARAEVAICYALAKELEDLGEWRRSFTWLARGARARRAQLSYRVEVDVAAIDAIRAAFDGPLLAQVARSHAAPPGPIFVVGLPRSGTTVVDRILASHPDVESFGELNDLPLAVMRAAGPAKDRHALIAQSARCDHAALGRDYLRRVAGYGGSKPYFVDKTPLNLLYLALIALALPAARIVHVRRDPLDNGYAMYKTLFRMGYPFSYDLGDLAHYYIAYSRLMAHWRRLLPGRFLDLDYEALVGSQEESTRALLAHCGLPFDPACLDFHRNPAATATASAAQVREPLHARSVGIARRYAAELEPLRAALADAGITSSTGNA
ncbi:MAG: sulfotransferase [Steroidobacteraceae bacterium]